MNLTSPFLKSVADMAGIPGDSVTSLLKMVADSTDPLAEESPDGWLGVQMSALLGFAAILAIVITLSVCFPSWHRNISDTVRHGLVATLLLTLLAFVAYDTRHAALVYLGVNPSKSAIEFEIRLPKSAASALPDSQVELHTDRNQTLAEMQGAVLSAGDGPALLRGSVTLDFRTTDRVLVLILPRQARIEFRLRLAASPSRSDQFGPWHLADRIAAPDGSEATDAAPNDAFAIRYRVL